MSNTRKTPAIREATKLEADGIKYVITDELMTATLPSRKQVKLSMVMDLEALFNLVEAMQAIDDDADVFETMAALRKIMPEDFLTAVKGIDSAMSLKVFMQWARLIGERLGKALT